MSRKRKKRTAMPSSRFTVGDRVRVKYGVMDPEYADLPLGGWAGTIADIDEYDIYVVRWSRETLASVHPIHKMRCIRDGLVLRESWLEEADLEDDRGGPLAIQQPLEGQPRPLSPDDASDRVRMVFDLTHDDLLPCPDDESLAIYYDYLAERLGFPFQAENEWAEPVDESFSPRVKVTALTRDGTWDEDDGIFCDVQTAEGLRVLPLASLRAYRSGPNRRLISDYTAWFVGELSGYDDDWEEDQTDEDDWDDANDEGGPTGADGDVTPTFILGRTGALGTLAQLWRVVSSVALVGAAVGSAVAAIAWAKWGAWLGSALLAVCWGVLQAGSAPKDWRPLPPRFRRPFGAVFGIVTGAIHGALLGVMVVAFVGALAGFGVGVLLKRALGEAKESKPSAGASGLGIFSAACGVVAQAFYVNRGQASLGLLWGALAGAALALVVCLGSYPLKYLVKRSGEGLLDSHEPR